MLMRTPLVRWLSIRVRVFLILTLVASAILPPYSRTLANSEEELEFSPQQFLFVEEGFLMKTSSLGEQGSRLAFNEGLVHRVKDGESVERIAARYGVTAQTIRWANGLTQASMLRPDQELVILPVDGVLHTVRRGQTLNRIAQLYDIPLDDIVRQNRIHGSFVVAGDQIIIPGGRPITEGSAIASADQNLRFANALPAKDIRLPIGRASAPTTAIAPSVSAILSQTLLQMPCQDCFFTQKYHPGHYAVDLQTRGGGPIFAAEHGTILRADLGWNGGFGNVIEVDHGNGLVTLYAHNRTLYVKKGDTVKRGQVIAEMGNTGLVHGPTGIHVHFEVRVNGVKRNPGLYLE